MVGLVVESFCCCFLQHLSILHVWKREQRKDYWLRDLE